MNNVSSFYIDETTKRALDELSKKGDSKSKIIRNALKFYEEFNFSDEIQALIEGISERTGLSRKEVVEEAVKVFQKIVEVDEYEK